MAWSVTFFHSADSSTGQCYGPLISSTTVTPSGTSADVTVPDGARIARIKPDSTGYVSNNGDAASATNGIPLASGDSPVDIGIYANKGLKIA